MSLGEKPFDDRVGASVGGKPLRVASRWFFRSLPVFLLLVSVCLYAEMLTPMYYPRGFGEFNGKSLSGVIFITLISWVFFFGCPALYGKWVLGKNLSDFGVRRPLNGLAASVWGLGGIALLVPYAFYATKLPSFQHYYAAPALPLVQLLGMNFLIFPLQYGVEEFYFRGFLFLELWRRLRWHSFWITEIFFTLAHLGKPGLEIAYCIPASIILNMITLKTKSIFPAVLVHACFGIVLFLRVNT